MTVSDSQSIDACAMPVLTSVPALRWFQTDTEAGSTQSANFPQFDSLAKPEFLLSNRWSI
jgi:hypothetical protein